MVVLWYAALVVFLLSTDHGRNARDWMMGSLCCCRDRINSRIVNDMMGREEELRRRVWTARRMRTVAARRAAGRARTGTGDGDRGPRVGVSSTLILKTRRFNAARETAKRRRDREGRTLDMAAAAKGGGSGAPAAATVAAGTVRDPDPELERYGVRG